MYQKNKDVDSESKSRILSTIVMEIVLAAICYRMVGLISMVCVCIGGAMPLLISERRLIITKINQSSILKKPVQERVFVKMVILGGLASLMLVMVTGIISYIL